MEWLSTTPLVAGWYVVLVCWDISEGSFPYSAYWNGSAWESKLPIVSRSSLIFLSKEAVKTWIFEAYYKE